MRQTPPEALRIKISAVLGQNIKSISPLSGGCVGEVYRIDLSDNTRWVVKIAEGPNATLSIEGLMLQYLKQHSQLPVPKVRHNSDPLLVMEYIDGSGSIAPTVEEHAAHLLAELHGITQARCGFEFDTLIGGLHQPNPWTPSWIEFFRKQRLLYMAHVAHQTGRLPSETLKRIESLSAQLPELLTEPEQAALLHGDIWSGNVLTNGKRISGFIDPAIYYGHPEIELAFITLFGTFGKRFFECYEKKLTIAPGFFETRRHIYNLYPLLVHVRLFGGGYIHQVEQSLELLGF